MRGSWGDPGLTRDAASSAPALWAALFLRLISLQPTLFPPPALPSHIRIFTIPPSFAGIFLTKSAKLSCLVTDLTTYDSLSISWTRQNGEALQTHTNVSESHANGTFSAVGEASVCVEEWESGERFTCTVTHTDLPSPLKHDISRPTGEPALASFPLPRALPRLLGSEDNEAGPGEPLRSPSSRTDPSRPRPDLTTVSPPQRSPSTCRPCTCCHQHGNS